MKKVILIGMMAVSLLSAKEELPEVCDMVAQTANVIMRLRQANAPMKETMKVFVAERNKGVWADLSKDIAIDAYSQPRFNVKKNQQTEVTAFENKWYLKCVKEQK